MSAANLIASAPSASPARCDGDEVSRSWIDCLEASGSRHDDCLARLHALLLRVARHEALRRARSLDIGGPEVEDVALQAADDALMAIRTKIADFRGESRFTTWAYRFVVYEVSTKIGRHFWRNRPVSMDQDDWERLPDPILVLPEERAELEEVLVELRRAIEEDLTQHQRRVFVAVALNDVPMDALAREIGANRNALYKTLFDARRKLRTSLASAGHALAVSAGGSS